MEREHITPQGVSIFHDKNENIHSFCLCLYVRAGSLFETKENNGISHFFEHIVFKNIHYQMGENLYQTLDRCGLDFNASTYEEFLFLMRAKGYEIKGETFGEDAAKYISFRPLDKERFVRGSARSLGKEYTKERIRERIEKKRERKAVIPKKDYSTRRLIDTSDEKFQNSPGLQQWAAIENLKIAAQSYNEAGSLSDLEHKITVKTETGRSARQSVVGLEHRMKDLAEIIKYAEQYKDNRSYHIGYKKAKNPDAYFRRYESQIILYGGARRVLEQAGIKLKGLNVDKLRAEYQALETQKKELTTTYKSCEKEVWNLKRKQENLDRYLGRAQTDPVQEQFKKKNNPIL